MKNTQQEGSITIPVMIDDIKDIDNIKFTRCTYFSVQCDTPSAGWSLGTSNISLPFIMMGLSGIICRPLEDSVKFTELTQIERLFEFIESQENLYIDINDIWLPNFAFQKGMQKRGTVWRVDIKIFTEALRFRDNTINFSDLEKMCKSYQKGVVYDDTETFVFQNWIDQQIAEAKRNYHSNQKRQLPKILKKP